MAKITRKVRKAFLPHRDLNASINIAHALMRGMRWGDVSPANQQMRGNGVKPPLNAGALSFREGEGAAHRHP